ncbi:MAG: hypothetical protein DMD81_07900, partial [Candidatus Rokuibacteriota bacterium]
MTDQDVPIVMRDGVTLYADVRRPDAPGRFPVLVTITPYNKLIAGETPTSLVERGYVHVAVDVRGQGSSEGTWGNQNEIEQMDSYEVVEWAAVQSWSDGNVGMWGSSYRGINQLLAAALRPPSLKAVFPIVSSADNYRDYSRTGGDSNFAFVPSWLALVLAAQNVPPLWAPQDPLQVALDYLAHAGSVSSVMVPLLVERYATQMYDENRVSSPYFKLDRVGVPVFLIGGLRDLFARGEPLNYEKLRALGQVPVKLLMLDGTHTQTIAGIGLPADGVPTLEQIALRWFDRFLKGIDTGIDNIPDVTQMVRGDGHFEVQPTWPHPELQPRRRTPDEPAPVIGAAVDARARRAIRAGLSLRLLLGEHREVHDFSGPVHERQHAQRADGARLHDADLRARRQALGSDCGESVDLDHAKRSRRVGPSHGRPSRRLVGGAHVRALGRVVPRGRYESQPDHRGRKHPAVASVQPGLGVPGAAERADAASDRDEPDQRRLQERARAPDLHRTEQLPVLPVSG